MAMGILGQLANIATDVRENVYIVPAGKVAVFNIFANASYSVSTGAVYINNGCISVLHKVTADPDAANAEIKSVIGNAGTIVQFQDCSGIVTGYEEDA
jgi:hypothetical protein